MEYARVSFPRISRYERVPAQSEPVDVLLAIATDLLAQAEAQHRAATRLESALRQLSREARLARQLAQRAFETGGGAMLRLGLGQQVGRYREEDVNGFGLSRHSFVARYAGKRYPRIFHNAIPNRAGSSVARQI